MFCVGSELAATSSNGESDDEGECPDAPTVASECDIGKLLELKFNVTTLSREEKYRILTREPNTDASSYPRTRASASAAFRQFQPSWLKSFPWLHYSQHTNGAFCRACAMFVPETVGGQIPGQFVTKAFRSWKKNR